MTYPDNSASSVNSLLALLRSAQDGSTPSISPSTSSQNPTQPSHRSPIQAQTSSTKPNIPSKRQLDDLLSSLNARAPTGKQERLIEPFGPVGEITSPSKPLYDPQNQYSSSSRPQSDTSADNFGRKGKQSTERNANNTPTPPKTKLKPFERINEQGYAFISFSKALPILSELLEDDNFKIELKKMKKEQDALERRLWAKREKIKAEHEKTIQAEKEIAKIARKVVPLEKKEAWARTLSSTLSTFYLQQCLQATDGLASKQRQILIELGVPGLGDDGEKGKDRVKRIMELLEAGLEE
ncbi:uncharacterized protein I206_105345 [Kwoniella pini CBS 10737]|uniref:Uncharacterized protein n=1 Tax=Kwoniella pini CBS 10737 TaxID=1296096 RepID=A0A1B9I4H1_9TREE|nr:uncharacterized protein I206_03745 [Kwoniella pini CBS 10737]OCF50423.1 hypothetical protein I206_03745 [Kwoniella pini CBS 10737]